MKIISIRQPWASLIIHHGKNIENRTWPTRYRGPLLIHASQRKDDITPKDILDRYGVRVSTHNFPTGGIIGIVDLVDCVADHPSRWFEGEYGFVLKNPRQLRFQAWSGQLGIFEAPRELLVKLRVDHSTKKPWPITGSAA